MSSYTNFQLYSTLYGLERVIKFRKKSQEKNVHEIVTTLFFFNMENNRLHNIAHISYVLYKLKKI